MIEIYLGLCGVWLFAMCFILLLLTVAVTTYPQNEDKAMVRYSVYGLVATPLAPIMFVVMIGFVFYSIGRTVYLSFKD